MRSFHDIRYTGAIGDGVDCEVAFNTDIVRTKSGGEYRNGLASRPRHSYRWTVARATTEIEDLRQFHAARKGTKYSFRFQDPFDHTLVKTVISTGSTGTEFDIVKRYAAGGSTFERTILLPDTSQTTVYVNSTKIDSTAWSITTAWQLHLNASPGAGNAVEVEGVFDVPVRFDAGFAARLASPDADEVDVELTEVKDSPVPVFSTGSTWFPQACNIVDSTFYFFDGFGKSSLSTNWIQCNVDALSTESPRPVTLGPGTWAPAAVPSSVSGGYYKTGDAGFARYYLLTCLKSPLRVPVRVRQYIHFSAKEKSFIQYTNQLTSVVSTGGESSLPMVGVSWVPGGGSIHVVAGSTYFPIAGMASTGTTYSGMLETKFYTTSVEIRFFPSQGSTITTQTLTAPVAAYTTAGLYLRFYTWGYDADWIDWIEVKSL